MDWQHLLAYITGTVDQALLLRNEYLVTGNRLLRDQITGRVRLTDGERKTLADIARVILCGEASLRHALTQYMAYDHRERNQQGKGNVLLLPAVSQDAARRGRVQCRERLGGLLKYYDCDAA